MHKLYGMDIKHPFELYLDDKILGEFLELMQQPKWKQKFERVIVQMLTDRLGNDKLYGREPHDTRAMKIKAHPQNSRLLCREFSNGKIVIVAFVEAHKARDKAMTPATKGWYKSISEYDYGE